MSKMIVGQALKNNKEFIDKFRPLFKIFVDHDNDILYITETEEEEENDWGILK